MASISELIIVTVVGMGVVFSVLILLALIIMGFKYIFYKEPEKGVAEEFQVESKMEREDIEVTNDEELVAVIAAAIASANPEMRFIVKNIVRIPDTSPAWGKIARQEQINRF